jgi:hypothetical protein
MLSRADISANWRTQDKTGIPRIQFKKNIDNGILITPIIKLSSKSPIKFNRTPLLIDRITDEKSLWSDLYNT